MAPTSVAASAYDWAHDLLFRPHLDVAGADQARFVDYYAGACPHCKYLDTGWKHAVSQWAADGSQSKKMVFQQRECLDANWQNGKDFEECEKAGIDTFPTIKFYKAGSDVGEEYEGNRDPESLLSFSRDVVDGKDVLPHPDLDTIGKQLKFTDYYSAACPHCKELDPIFDKAMYNWAKLPDNIARGVLWTKKECYDRRWQPGRDAEECQRENIDLFPTLRLTAVNSLTGATVKTLGDFRGGRRQRTPESLHRYVTIAGGLDEESGIPAPNARRQAGAGPPPERRESLTRPGAAPSPSSSASPKVAAAQPSSAAAPPGPAPAEAAALAPEPEAAGGGAEAAAVKAAERVADAADGTDGAGPDHPALMKLPMPAAKSMPLIALASPTCPRPPKARNSRAKQLAVSSFI